jgi:ABC-type glycerol-3-phosphate transport system substrate-binding protein
MSASARAACTFDGRMPVVPVNNAFMGVAYNKDIFKQHNLAPPENLADLERIMDVLKTDPAVTYPMIWGADTSYNMSYMMQLSVLYDTYPDFDERMAANTINYNNPENQFIYKKLFVDWPAAGYYNYDNCNGTERMSMGALQFTDGRAAMMHIGSWDIKTLADLNERNIPVGMFPMPGINHSGNVVSAAGEAFAISVTATGNEKAAAVELLNIVMSPQINGTICGLTDSLSPYSDVQMNNSPEMIAQLFSYVNDKARGWNVAPLAMQAKMGECLNITTADSGDKQAVLDEHLDYMDRLWKESL